MLNVSTGCEPFFMISYQRRTVSLNNEETFYTVNIPVAQEYYKMTGADSLPDYFVTAAQIDWKERIDMQAAMQNYVDTAISSTLNLPKGTTPADIKGIYLRAWSKGLKGVTVYVDGSRDPILSSDKEEQKSTQCFDCISPTSRKEIGTTYGQTMCKKCACGTLYITANKDKDGNFVELFTHTSKGGICQANLNAVTRGISLALRSGIKVEEIIDQLKGIHCPACAMAKAKKHPIDGMSCPDIISKAMSEFTKFAGSDYDIDKGNTCPECGAPLVHIGGCVSCSCGWSRCG